MTYSDAIPIAVQSELASASARITTQSHEITSQLSALRAHLDEILAHWRGGANMHYNGLKAEWDMAANGLFNVVLGEVAQALHLNWNNYVDAESANIQTWTRR